jgi:hypothetical protein
MKNLVKIYKELKDKSGQRWYFEAHSFAQYLAEKYNKPIEITSAIMSALSPGTHWEQNKKDAEALLSIDAGKNTKKYKFVTYGQNVIKAERILTGQISPFEAFSEKTGAKTYNFFYNILQPDSDQYVTVDRHAFKIATGREYTGLKGKQYRIVKEHYIKAAKRIGISPPQLQAALWVQFRIDNTVQKDIVPF